MAETLKQTESRLKSQIAALLNQAARERDVKKQEELKAKAKTLKEKLDGVTKQSGASKNLSTVEKAKKELARLEALDPNTPGVAPLKAVQIEIINNATKKGLPPLKGTPSFMADPSIAANKKDDATAKAAADKAAAAKAAAAKAAANKTKKPITKPGAVVPKGFDPGSFRMADEASMAKAGGTLTGVKTATGADDINAIYTLARSKYGNVDSIFLYDPELRQLLIEAVGDPTTAVGDMDPEEFARRLAASDWAIRNSTTYAKRDAERRQYTETLDKYNEQLKLADTQDKKDAILAKIGQLNTTSSYARGLASAKAYIESVASGLTGTMDPARLDAFVKRMYDSANDKDPNIINRELSALISYKPGNQLGGAIGGDLVTLRATAKANGFDLDKTFGDQINGWLQRLAKGESVETFKNVIRSQAKLGLPDKVSNLLDQGLDLANIYEPYKRLMANVLELAPDAIDLNDATLRSAIGADKEMSLYEFQRTLRKDSRWQYTDNARADVSSSVLQVLRDFGFQG
jgi:hypothetical protein